MGSSRRLDDGEVVRGGVADHPPIQGSEDVSRFSFLRMAIGLRTTREVTDVSFVIENRSCQAMGVQALLGDHPQVFVASSICLYRDVCFWV